MKIHDLSYCRDAAENIVGGCPFYQNTEIHPSIEVNIDPDITVDPDGEPAIDENIDTHLPTDLVFDFPGLIIEIPPELSGLFVSTDLPEVPTYVHWPDVD